VQHRTQVDGVEEQRTLFQTRSVNRGALVPSGGPAAKPVFIHVSKNAGSSIVSTAGASILNAGHRTAVSWAREHGEGHPLFAVIRNPYDRVVSEYFYRKRRYNAGDRNSHVSNLSKSFEDWALSTYRDGELRTRSFFEDAGIAFSERNMIGDQLIWFIPQTDWLGDGQGRLLVHDFLRFENLKWDWMDWAEQHSLPVRLPTRNVSDRKRDYRVYYSAETRRLIADYYREDLEAFGYVF
jgi:hypothetical protein